MVEEMEEKGEGDWRKDRNALDIPEDVKEVTDKDWDEMKERRQRHVWRKGKTPRVLKKGSKSEWKVPALYYTTPTGALKIDRMSTLSVWQVRMIRALRKSKGVVNKALRIAGVSRESHYAWVKDNEAYAFLVAEIKQYVDDLVDEVLIEKALSGNVAAITAYQKKSQQEAPDTKKRGKGVLMDPSWDD